MSRSRLALLALAVLGLFASVAVGTSAAAPAVPTYASYDLGFSGGEPSIGYDLKADAAVVGAGTTNKRLTWDDSVSPAKITIADASAPSSATTLDAITFTDQVTNRTFVSQLVLACSITSYSDDAGKNYTPSEGCGPGVLLDHQTYGGGPYAMPKPPNAGLTGYPDAAYYCAQNGFSGTCARSDDGGLTFGTAVPAYNTPANGGTDGGACSAIHGHLRVGPNGTVYLPNKGCGGTPTAGNLTNSEFFGGAPALSVSKDNGNSWTVHPVPGAHNQDESDPSVAADKAGTVFFGWEDGTNPSETTFGTTSAAKISVSKDQGTTWSTPYDVSSALGLHNVQFPEVIAGDPGRAAFAFYGTPGTGDDQHVGFVGEWHLYVASTTDNGASWTTVDATPANPLQRGCISLQGTSNKNAADDKLCNQRNLLDFNDITLDKAGRVIVAFTDGCSDACQTDAKSGSKGARDFVIRQSGGPLLRTAAVAAAATPSSGATPSGGASPSSSPSPGGLGLPSGLLPGASPSGSPSASSAASPSSSATPSSSASPGGLGLPAGLLPTGAASPSSSADPSGTSGGSQQPATGSDPSGQTPSGASLPRTGAALAVPLGALLLVATALAFVRRRRTG